MEILLLLVQLHIHGVDGLPDWYDPICCNTKDCRPVEDDKINFEIILGEIIAIYKPTSNRFTKNQFRKSQDDRYHVCISESGSSYCFYDRTGA